MRDLTEHEQLTLYALTTLAAEDATPARSRIVYQRYKEPCEFQDRDPCTARRMRSFLSDFEILNLTLSHMEHRGQDGGTYREHELNRDIATVVDALQTIISEFGAHRTWQDKFNRHVQEGEQAIWIWAPIITTRCPECYNSPSYHDRNDCTYDETSPEEWLKGLVGFGPTAVFDILQTEGEPRPTGEY